MPKVRSARPLPRFRGGQAPLGFARTGQGRLRLLAREARLVRTLFREYPRRGSLGRLAAWLDREGLSNRGRPWTRQTLFWILTNPVYLGWVRDDRAPGGRRRAHPALVSGARFGNVQGILAGRCRNPNPGRRRDEQPATVAAGAGLPRMQALEAAR